MRCSARLRSLSKPSGTPDTGAGLVGPGPGHGLGLAALAQRFDSRWGQPAVGVQRIAHCFQHARDDGRIIYGSGWLAAMSHRTFAWPFTLQSRGVAALVVAVATMLRRAWLKKPSMDCISRAAKQVLSVLRPVAAAAIPGKSVGHPASPGALTPASNQSGLLRSSRSMSKCSLRVSTWRWMVRAGRAQNPALCSCW